MILVDAQLPDAADDFALELYFMRMKNPPEMMFLWRNPPTLMLGRNQELQQEIAVEEAERNNILIRRRYSGGGTIYTDFGTVQVTHLIPNAPNPSECLEFEGRNLARALNQLNVPAVLPDEMI